MAVHGVPRELPASDEVLHGLVALERGRLTGAVPASGEDFHLLTTLGDVRIEHIVSAADPDPAPQVQAWDEWVLVLAGAAALDVAGQPVELSAGEWLVLPAGTQHRVRRADAGTQWLAVHGPVQPFGEPTPAQPADARAPGAD